MTMLKPKFVMVPVFDAAVRVRVAERVAPAFKTLFARFQVNVKYVAAVVGCQLLVVMLRVTGRFPVFLT